MGIDQQHFWNAGYRDGCVGKLCRVGHLFYDANKEAYKEGWKVGNTKLKGVPLVQGWLFDGRSA